MPSLKNIYAYMNLDKHFIYKALANVLHTYICRYQEEYICYMHTYIYTYGIGLLIHIIENSLLLSHAILCYT